MCGFIAAVGADDRLSDSAIQRGLARMARRGPDAVGYWRDQGVALGHRRLAIVDLDPRSAQPFHSGCGRYVIAFNGEIYNFRSLRQELCDAGAVLRTTSDTEVLLELFLREGEAVLPRLLGMFAFVIWDRQLRRAFAARDPYGIKPLYMAKADGAVLLGSQVKALMATGMVSRRPDARGQAGFWMLGSVPEPHTWYADVRPVAPGSSLWVEDGRVVGERLWCEVADAWRTAKAARGVSDDAVALTVASAMREVVGRHLVADVPVGVFLSGGIDSTVLAALMVEGGAQTVQGVTLAYDEFAGRHEDESPAAAQIARHYGIRHHVRHVGPSEFIQDMPRIVDAMDQPSIDGVNTWYASKAVAEQGLKVVVSGVGGDELFLGYESFRSLPTLQRRWSAIAAIPGLPALGAAAGRVQARRSGNPEFTALRT